jgi:hypothetical protein
MVKASKLESCPLKVRSNAKFPILFPGQSQSAGKKRLQLRHLGFDIINSLETIGKMYSFYFLFLTTMYWCSG